MKPQFKDSWRVQQLPIFGRNIYNQKVVQPVITNETAQLNLQREQTERVTYQPQILPVQRSATTHRHIVPVAHNIPNFINVPVNVPVEHRVPQYIDKFVRYEIKAPENVYRNVSDVKLNVGNMKGRGLTVNSGPGFYNKNYSKIDGCEGRDCSSSEEYHGRHR